MRILSVYFVLGYGLRLTHGHGPMQQRPLIAFNGKRRYISSDLQFNLLLFKVFNCSPAETYSVNAMDSVTSALHISYVSASNATESRPKRTDELPSGFYDSVENPISEKEYWRQIEFEQKNDGLPFVRDKESEQRRLRAPLSISTYATSGCEGERTKHITERGACYESPGGQSYSVESLPSDCELTTYTDGSCTEEPFPCNWGIDGPSGCFITDAFESLKVTTRKLPA